MGAIVEFLKEFASFFWPWDIVQEWEHGVYYRLGRFRRVVGPGGHFAPKWFTKIIVVTRVPAIVKTGRMDLTLSDGTSASFVATASVCVIRPADALNTVDSYQETMSELLESVLADKISEVDHERLAPEKRKRLLTDLTRWVDEEAQAFGVEVKKVRFTTCVLNVRAYRLLNDIGGSTTSW